MQVQNGGDSAVLYSNRKIYPRRHNAKKQRMSRRFLHEITITTTITEVVYTYIPTANILSGINIKMSQHISALMPTTGIFIPTSNSTKSLHIYTKQHK
jgi:hypothetical protein